MEIPKTPDHARGEMANIGKSVVIKGELSGSEDLYIDGQVEGSIELKGNRLMVGPNGRVKANVNARSASIQGKMEGNIRASDRVDLKQTAVVTGDIATQRISIEDGAYFRGGVDIQKEAPLQGSKPESKVEAKPAPAPAGAASSSGPSTSAPSPALEPRK
ncbi:MAG: cell shape determination protein CcmA [Acidobacteria bacterium]|jgi:cytoskeletal protein CcmA (bactofilin family)|nr:MAG: cell shape determination protein CcmA [Acidobacteriota bacterium]